MKIEFLGADREVTGSCHYVAFGETHFLVDCGMEQGADLYVNQEIPVNPATIDYVFVTHAHIDHSGLLPLLYNHGFRGKIFATTATCELCNIMLKDSAHIQEFEAEWKNRKARRAGRPEVTPMYNMEDAQGVLEHFVPCTYHETVQICEGLTIRFVDAGHLLGSSSIEIWVTEDGETRKLVFSGDIGNYNRPLIRDPEYLEEADYVIMESTYGNRNHNTPPDYAAELAKVMNSTFTKGGNLVIPAFSVGRTQEMLYYMRRIKTEGLLPEYPGFEVYIDSPLAVEATNIFHKSVEECFSGMCISGEYHTDYPEKDDEFQPEIQSDYLGFRHVRSRPYPASFETQPVADGFYDSVCRLSGAGNAGLFSVKRSKKGKTFRRGN